MKDFNIFVKSSVDHKWYTVIAVSFRNWNNHPDDGINMLKIFGDNGPESVEDAFIEEIRFNIW